MEILLAIAGIAGLAALLTQSKPLPTEAEYKKAMDKLVKNPTDPDASLIVGKYIAFVEGDYKMGMIFLSNSSDTTLKALGEHEIDPLYTDNAKKKVGMGDEWVTAAKKFPALSRIFYDRAAQWYVAAWPDLDAAWKTRTRKQGRKLALSRPPGPARKDLPVNWVASPGVAGRPPVLDGNMSRTGSYSVKIPPADEKVKDSGSSLASEALVVDGKTFEASAHILADGTENATDRIFMFFYDQGGNALGHLSAYVPVDLPFWNRVVLKGDVPKDAVRAVFSIALYSKKGSMWVDDVSVKFENKEAVKNGSFEGK